MVSLATTVSAAYRFIASTPPARLVAAAATPVAPVDDDELGLARAAVGRDDKGLVDGAVVDQRQRRLDVVPARPRPCHLAAGRRSLRDELPNRRGQRGVLDEARTFLPHPR